MLLTVISRLELIGIILMVTTPIAVLWACGIDKMHKEHPDYKGEDLFDENYKEDEK